MRCQAHQTYVGLGKPISTCKVCWIIYAEAHRSDKQFCDKHPVELKEGKCPVCEGGHNGTLPKLSNPLSAGRHNGDGCTLSVRVRRGRSNAKKH
jgi:hypothetical protein